MVNADQVEESSTDDFPEYWEWGRLFASNPELIELLELLKDRQYFGLNTAQSPTTDEQKAPRSPSSAHDTTIIRAPKTIQQTRSEDSSILGLVVDYANGMTQQEIAIKHRLHVQTVRKHLKAAGVNVRQHNSSLSAHDLHQARRLLESGQSLRRTAQHFGIAHTTLQRALQKAHLSPWSDGNANSGFGPPTRLSRH